MILSYLEKLQNELENGKQFPPSREYKYRTNLSTYTALRESNAAFLRPSWWFEENPTGRDYIVDPLAERIPQVWADMLFGEEASFEAKVKKDQERLEHTLDTSDIPSLLKWAEEVCSSEGEVWSRLVSQPELRATQIEFHSRLNVIPYFLGRVIVSAAVVSVLEEEENGKQWVYVEYHCEGYVRNRLYYHTKSTALGEPVAMTLRPETAELRPEWDHKLDMLVGRIVNRWGKDWRCGVSDYQGVAGLLLALNEITNIGQENVRLTGKQRVVVPQRYLTDMGSLPRGAEVLIATEVDQDPDKIKNDFAQIEWKFDAEALIAYKSDVVDSILTRARIAPQLVGRHTESAQTGPALRARLLDSVLAAQGKGKEWDEEIPVRVSLAAQVEALTLAEGGSGNEWSKPADEPTFKRKSPLPEDEEARSRRTVTEVNASILSRETAIQLNNPEWGEGRVTQEMDRLREERAAGLQDGAPTSGSSEGDQGVPNPAKGTIRKPGEAQPTSLVDPAKAVRN